MTTIVATPQPATASIALTLTPTASITQVLRTDANGIHPVRTQTGQLPTASATVLVDNEAALSGTVTYTAVGGAGATATTTLNLPGDLWLTVPVTPARSERLGLVSGYTSARSSRSTVHEVIDRADPVVALGPLGWRTGTLEVWCPTLAVARAFEAVYDRGEVVQLRQDIPGADMYHVAHSTLVEPQSDDTQPRRWRLAVDYVEVGWPVGDQSGTLGWSIDDVTATYATVAALTLAFPTVNDLTIGPLP